MNLLNLLFVYFSFLNVSSFNKISTLQYALQHCQKQHSVAGKFSTQFYNELLQQISEQLFAGVKWYDFLIGTDEKVPIIANIPETALSVDEMISDIISHKQKVLSIKPYINLSNAVVTTLSAATIAQKVESSMIGSLAKNNITNQVNINTKKISAEPDSVVFTCSHNLPRYYMSETVVPEFKSRMSELPEPLSNTSEIMGKFYDQTYTRVPMACPYCVYNNLRNSQLQLMRETGADLMNVRSSVWEI